MKTFLFLISFLLLSSCGQEPRSMSEPDLQSLSAQGTQSQIACSCAFHYDPVCGVNGLTFINSCIASCEGVSYRPGACADGQKACNPSSGYVCGQPACADGDCVNNSLPPIRVFANECTMMQSNAAFLHRGYCQ